ncbi:MAG: hypothetical protein LC132_08735 [Burkholderiales bacterium]|jgi:hypothetical protein|nr:hypothetical protein [Burkholderiales bacterium]HNQ64245.1 hypothetical protein [Syntrophorhabdaceae bacterium]HOD79549.1 hypothetical protein [Syntrophorhabdus sp.]
MSETHTHKDPSKYIRKKVRHKRSLKTRLKNSLSLYLGKGKEKVIYIIIAIVLAIIVAKALLWYIKKTEEASIPSINVVCQATPIMTNLNDVI